MPFLLTICSTIDCLGGIVFRFKKLKYDKETKKCQPRDNTGWRFKKVCVDLMSCTPKEAEFLYENVRNGFTHGGFGEMLAITTPDMIPHDECVFLTHHEQKDVVLLHLKHLAERLITAIEYVNTHRELIIDRPGEGANQNARAGKTESNLRAELMKKNWKGSSVKRQ